VARPDPRDGRAQRKLVEVWMDFSKGGKLYAICNPMLPEGLGEHLCGVVLRELDAYDEAN
jgi:hypothetical protein